MINYYDSTRFERGLKGTIGAIDDLKNWIHNNLFILKVGVIKEFDHENQLGKVLIDELVVEAKVLHVLRFSLHPNDQVILIQAREDLFSESDGIHFDIGSVYILQPFVVTAVSLQVQDMAIKADSQFSIDSGLLKMVSTRPIGFKAGNISLKDLLGQLITTIEQIRVIGGDAAIDYPSLLLNTSQLRNILNGLLE